MRRWLWRIFLFLVAALLVAIAASVRLDRDPAEVEARWATPPSKFVAAAGLRVHVRDRGAGPVLILLHGSNSSLFTWEACAQDLAADHRVISLDLPGHGLTGPDPHDRYAPRDMAEVVDKVADALGVDRFSLAGNSMGGQVALAYVLDHRRRVDKLVLVDSVGLPREEPRPFAFRIAGMPVLGEIVRWVTPRFLVAASVRDVFGDPTKATEARIDQYYDLLLRAGNRRATFLRFSAPEDNQIAPRLGELRLPVLILWGSRDRWVLPKYGERLRDAIAGARLVVLDGLGHIPMEEDPARTARLMRDFLKP